MHIPEDLEPCRIHMVLKRLLFWLSKIIDKNFMFSNSKAGCRHVSWKPLTCKFTQRCTGDEIPTKVIKLSEIKETKMILPSNDAWEILLFQCLVWKDIFVYFYEISNFCIPFCIGWYYISHIVEFLYSLNVDIPNVAHTSEHAAFSFVHVFYVLKVNSWCFLPVSFTNIRFDVDPVNDVLLNLLWIWENCRENIRHLQEL